MFGKEYANHLNLLTQSFEQMTHKYREKLKTARRNVFIDKLKKFYISTFGIPEIGFQIRSIYFSKTISYYILNNHPKNILDAGCGIGLHTFWLGKKFNKAKVMGGDIDTFKLESCKALTSELGIKNVSFSYFDVLQMSKVKAYDLIIAIDVLEHIENYNLALANLSKILHKGGYLYIHVPQPNQQRIFSVFKKWYHQDHAHDGITRTTLESVLKKLEFRIIIAKETFGFFGKLAWELNHLMLSKSFFIAGITYPLLYVVAKIDLLSNNHDGLGIAILAKKE